MQPPVHPFDRLHGTDTSGLLPASWLAAGTDLRLGDLTAYYGVAPSILRSLIHRWREELNPRAPLEDTVFLDVGAGKGRACLIAAEYPFLRVLGLEINAALADIAIRNIQQACGIDGPGAQGPCAAPVTVHCVDATAFPLPAEPTLAFLFHPFERTVLRRFLRRVHDSLTRAPRPFDLLYTNAEHEDILERHPAVQRLWRGRVAMSAEDHAADLAEIANQAEYGSTGDELCAIYRFTTTGRRPPIAGADVGVASGG